ncbi:hypothetical protein AJ80_09750 [Polytolypa hystricis UAMH7299]|uniref:Uncharacterized protein n=1 Tax=Polytolypa hystricis (strain UAMH7299) TaxID=1447883 RepID=A0A2B7WKG8_POLH7|nr:hypothetical protein AJ80_09750 [Polytolypa hystricis UAMH7299]
MESFYAEKLRSYSSRLSLPQLSPPPERSKLSLHEIKLLYLRRRYKQCAARSIELLKGMDKHLHPIHRAFLYYYTAASYEALGRAAHNYSSNRLPLLHLARDNYIGCNSALSTASRDARNGGGSSSSAERGQASTTATTTIDRRKGGVLTTIDGNACPSRSGQREARGTGKRAPPPQNSSQENVYAGQYQIGENHKLMPPPLRIRKWDRENDKHTSSSSPSTSSRPLPIPPSNNQRFSCPEMPSPKQTTMKPKSPNSPFDPYHNTTNTTTTIAASKDNTPSYRPQFYTQITSLTSQIDTNITHISSLILQTTELQRIHNATKNRRLASFWSFTPAALTSSSSSSSSSSSEKSASKTPENNESRQHRIVRLRADGWRTVGLKAPGRGWKGVEHYERVCGEALADLYGV